MYAHRFQYHTTSSQSHTTPLYLIGFVGASTLMASLGSHPFMVHNDHWGDGGMIVMVMVPATMVINYSGDGVIE